MDAIDRHRRIGSTFETFVQDVRYGTRGLLRTPGFTLAALVTLTLGIGANTAIFSVVNAVLLRPLPYPEPDRIVQLMRRHPTGTQGGQTGRRYLFFRDNLRSVAALAAWRSPSGFNLATGDTAEFVKAMSVSKEFFDVFGLRPSLGSAFGAEHDVAGGPDVAVLSHGLWQRLFGGNPAVVGTAILLGGRSYTVLGVMPSSFVFSPASDLLIPLRPSTTGPGGGFNYGVVGRLAPATSREQANAEAAGVWRAMSEQFPREILRDELPTTFEGYHEVSARGARPALLMILGAVAMLLLIACANTANLLLARAAGRGREIAVRAALGAARGRIVRQLLTESLLLSIAGSAAGVLVARWIVPALLALTPPTYRLNADVRIDAAVLGTTLLVALVTGVLFGTAPALSLSRLDLVDAFKDDGTRAIGSHRSAWLRRALVVGEVAVCVLLLVGAGLLVRTFANLRRVDPGFDPRGVLTAQMSLQGERYADPRRLNQFFEQGLDRIRRLPGVQAAAVVNGVPIEFGLNLNVDVLDGPDKIERALTDWRYASVDYFRTMGIPIVGGRGFESRDVSGAPPVAVVNEEFARRLFKGVPAIGRHIRVYDTDGAIEIVGIAKNVREQGLVGRLPVTMYVPVAQANPAGIRTSHVYFPMSWVVRTSGPSPDLIGQMRDAIRTLDPQQPFSSFRTMEEVKMAEVRTERFQMTLLTIFGAIGLVLAAAGVYGLLAYSVAQRTREFGIRMALGASHGRILAGVVRSGATLTILGLVIGMAASALAARSLRAFVWGLSVLDPLTYAAVAALLLAVAIGASVVPALRAVRMNPVAALRD
jgi:putative ABC transport system permease protein